MAIGDDFAVLDLVDAGIEHKARDFGGSSKLLKRRNQVLRQAHLKSILKHRTEACLLSLAALSAQVISLLTLYSLHTPYTFHLNMPW